AVGDAGDAGKVEDGPVGAGGAQPAAPLAPALGGDRGLGAAGASGDPGGGGLPGNAAARVPGADLQGRAAPLAVAVLGADRAAARRARDGGGGRGVAGGAAGVRTGAAGQRRAAVVLLVGHGVTGGDRRAGVVPSIRPGQALGDPARHLRLTGETRRDAAGRRLRAGHTHVRGRTLLARSTQSMRLAGSGAIFASDRYACSRPSRSDRSLNSCPSTRAPVVA